MSTGNHENDRASAETNRISAEGGRIGSEAGRTDAETGRAEAETGRVLAGVDRASRRRRINLAQLGAYLLIVVVAALGFSDISKTQENLCKTADRNRSALRGVIRAIDDLGSALVKDGRLREELSKEEKKALLLLENFREAQLRVLERPICKEEGFFS